MKLVCRSGRSPCLWDVSHTRHSAGKGEFTWNSNPSLSLIFFFVFSFVFFCDGLVVGSLHFSRIVVVCGDMTWKIPRHGVVCPCGVIHSWILCVLIHSCNFRIIVFFFWYFHYWNFLFLLWCCHSWNLLFVVASSLLGFLFGCRIPPLL